VVETVIGVCVMKTCETCNVVWPSDRFNPECASPGMCFKCRSSTISLGFGGQRTHFHNHTDKEVQRRIIAEARAGGHDPVPAWDKAMPFTGPAAGSMKKLEKVNS
jgi:hypothetical protein